MYRSIEFSRVIHGKHEGTAHRIKLIEKRVQALLERERKVRLSERSFESVSFETML